MKYMGSKARIAKHILPIILKDRTEGQWYVEPFVGGANLIDKVLGNRIGADINPYLIALLTKLSNGWEPPKITREMHAEIRDNKDSFAPHIVGWAGFCCSYCGVWFGGFSGETKTKIGTIRDYQQEAINNVSRQAQLINDVIFVCDAYYDLVFPDDSLIYCDPPYEGVSKYKDDFEHVAFWDWVSGKSLSGHKVFVSEYNAPDDFECVWSKDIKSSLSANGNGGGNKSSLEKLFVFKL